jgi:hypothetical protein
MPTCFGYARCADRRKKRADIQNGPTSVSALLGRRAAQNRLWDSFFHVSAHFADKRRHIDGA